MASNRPAVFITGASAGIGAACVKVFAAAGWNVTAAARRLDRLEALAREVKRAHSETDVLPVVCDVDDDASVAMAFKAHAQKFGQLDALVNNAGYGVYGTVEDTPLERYRENFETNFFGVLRCTKAALPLLRAAVRDSTRHAAIVMVSSFVGKRALPGMSAYCASKHALEALSESLRTELSGERIGVSVINPGVTRTEFFNVADGERPKSYLTPTSGMSAEAVAEVILAAARRPRRNAYLTFSGKAGLLAQWLSPRLLDWIMAGAWKKEQGK